MINESFGYPSFHLLAPTGQAAVNVGCTTIHCFVKIHLNDDMAELYCPALRSLQLAFERIKYIIIDEYSMMSLRHLEKIHLRLREAKSRVNENFGGIFIYFLVVSGSYFP